MSYNARSGHGYGNQRRPRGNKSFSKKKKPYEDSSEIHIVEKRTGLLGCPTGGREKTITMPANITEIKDKEAAEFKTNVGTKFADLGLSDSKADETKAKFSEKKPTDKTPYKRKDNEPKK
jgi:hypothetical protein